MLEFHYERTLEDEHTISSGPIVLGTPNSGQKTNLSMVIGTSLQIGSSEAISVGYSVPVGNSSDQLYDGQLRAVWNRYF